MAAAVIAFVIDTMWGTVYRRDFWLQQEATMRKRVGNGDKMHKDGSQSLVSVSASFVNGSLRLRLFQTPDQRRERSCG
jgi:hypothetical protein